MGREGKGTTSVCMCIFPHHSKLGIQLYKQDDVYRSSTGWMAKGSRESNAFIAKNTLIKQKMERRDYFNRFSVLSLVFSV